MTSIPDQRDPRVRAFYEVLDAAVRVAVRQCWPDTVALRWTLAVDVLADDTQHHHVIVYPMEITIRGDLDAIGRVQVATRRRLNDELV